MIPLTSDQRQYKERTLKQLLTNQAMLETSLEKETRPEIIKSIEKQLEDIETHISRLQDELAGNVIFDEPVADELFKLAARALSKERFYLAKKYATRLETIEPFYPGIDRLKQEAESQQVSRRTRSIAQGTATSYPGVTSPVFAPPAASAGATAESIPAGEALPPPAAEEELMEEIPWYRALFQFHIIVSCLVVLLLLCSVLGVGGFSLLEWFIAGL